MMLREGRVSTLVWILKSPCLIRPQCCILYREAAEELDHYCGLVTLLGQFRTVLRKEKTLTIYSHEKKNIMGDSVYNILCRFAHPEDSCIYFIPNHLLNNPNNA